MHLSAINRRHIYRIQGIDCAEEVTLKHEVGPVMYGEKRLAFLYDFPQLDPIQISDGVRNPVYPCTAAQAAAVLLSRWTCT